MNRWGPFVNCPHCGKELDTENPTGHRMIFYTGWTHRGEPRWECDADKRAAALSDGGEEKT